LFLKHRCKTLVFDWDQAEILFGLLLKITSRIGTINDNEGDQIYFYPIVY
jgi:hypothetical protein